MNTPTLIYRCPDAFGLGATIVMVAAYADYCRRHELTLALDMRRFQYFSQNAHDAFFETFDILTPEGPPLVTDLSAIDRLAAATDCLRIERANRLSADAPPPAPILDVDGVMNRWIVPWFAVAPPPGFAVRLKGWLRDKVEAALATRNWDNVVGIHFRHGNGEFLQTREDFLTASDYRERIARFEDALAARLIETAGGRAVFVASDNREFVAAMLKRVPRVFTLGIPIPETPYIEYLREVGPERALAEAAIDLWALASCAEVVCGHSSYAEAIAVIDPSARLHVVDDFKLGRSGVESSRAAQMRLLVMPQDGTMWRRLADAFAAEGRSEQARACSQVADERASAPAPPPQLKAQLLAAAGIAQTVADLSRELAIAGYESHAARNMARILANAGLPEQGVALLGPVIAANPSDPRLHASLANLCDMQERWSDAVAAARRAVELAPRSATYRLLLVKALHRAGDPAARQSLVGVASMRKTQPDT